MDAKLNKKLNDYANGLFGFDHDATEKERAFVSAQTAPQNPNAPPKNNVT